ncbi:MAG: acetyl-CoA carboxylase biotin carboxyl carrier protein subunit [Anaerolineae bacterium]|nr:acetyl-CoA carboxylase biotin carboxyl carrier protein subunit [Anaerolineae bacterium]
MKYITTIGEREFNIEILDDDQVKVDDVIYQVDFESVSGQPVFSMLVDGKSYEAHIFADDGDWHVMLQGNLYIAQVEDERERRLRAASGEISTTGGEFILKAPMPGLVVKVPVKEGDQIEKGDVLLILESMKMQNELKSPREGVISRVQVKEGDSVEQKETLLALE